ncbi:hypothetical protein GIY23_08260 [Allosaccharopolyspora coralli]|uniref:Uncharacterized protein n=1 Tax=Allosaccharopolyspora coralli TaxID=2665642 RepID=A0A5Q3QFC2_9PSEU|nr:hypothetical protein [Allosaccharopolyspora coralli]QGK69517.1 hypothetical protein GIY23_08260 [Allosaccharopolyspora coralli]
MRTASSTDTPDPPPAFRAAVSLIVLLAGGSVLGALYGTDDLMAQLLAALLLLPFMLFYLVGSSHLTSQSWTVTVHFLATLAIPFAVVGVPSWWLLLAGDRLPGCLVQFVIETQGNRGLSYDHEVLCEAERMDYTSRGDPIAQGGDRLDMLTDPTGILAPVPSPVVPTGFGWITLAVVAAALAVAVVEVVRQHRTAPSGTDKEEYAR